MTERSANENPPVDCTLRAIRPFKTIVNGLRQIAAKSYIGAEDSCQLLTVTQSVVMVADGEYTVVASAPLVQEGLGKAHYQTIYGPPPICGDITTKGNFIDRLHVEMGDGSAFWDIDSEVSTVSMLC